MRLVDVPAINEGLRHMMARYPRLELLCPDPFTSINREIAGDPYHNLVRIVVGQQVSTAAARTIWGRVVQLLGDGFDPSHMAQASFDDLRACGLSGQKVKYITGMSQAVADGHLNPHLFHDMSDDELAAAILALKGFGQWSVDMYMIFSLGRGNVWPVGDLGVRVGLQNLMELPQRPDDAQMAHYGAEFAPYGTAAALLMWDIKDKAPAI